MTEEIINSDGSRNWQANILLDNVKRLEQENKELLETLTKGCYQNLQHECRIWELKESKYRSALEEIKEDIRSFYGCEDSSNDYKLVNMIDKINEVLK